MDVKAIVFDRQYRTPNSEAYSLRQDQVRIARLDVHFTAQSVYGTLVILQDFETDDILGLIEHIDESIVLSAETPREDFYVTVFRGSELGFFSDDFQANQKRRVSVRPGARLDNELIDETGEET